MKNMYFILRDGVPVECTLMEWASSLENWKNRVVGRDAAGDGDVRTDFLGLNYAFDDGPPLVFETMVFGGKHDGYTEHYSTLKEAKAGHERIVKMVKSKINLI